MAGKYRRVSLHRVVFLTFLVIVLSLAGSFLYVYSTFHHIENISELTKDRYLPQLIDKQRILVNIETMRQQLELIYTSDRPDVLRKARVVAQALIAEAVFEQSSEFHEKVLHLKPDIMRLLDLKEKIVQVEDELHETALQLERTLGRLSLRTGRQFGSLSFQAHGRMPSDDGSEGDMQASDLDDIAGVDGICKGNAARKPDCMALKEGREAVRAYRQSLRELDGQAFVIKERLKDGLHSLSDYAVTREVLKIASDMSKVENTASRVRMRFFLLGCVVSGLLLGIGLLIRFHILNPLLSMVDFLRDLRKGRKPGELSPVRIREMQQIMDMLPVLQSAMERLSMRTSLLMEERDEYARLSLRDALTGLGNRWALEERKKADISGLPLAVIMFDIDFFKKYNDAFGHLEGDKCLRQVASIARGSLHRHSDAVFRYGGEEFVVLIPGADAAAAQIVAERLRDGVRQAGIAHPGVPGGMLSVSVGVACRGLGEATSFDTLVEQADQALYTSKRNGRDRVTVFSE